MSAHLRGVLKRSRRPAGPLLSVDDPASVAAVAVPLDGLFHASHVPAVVDKVPVQGSTPLAIHQHVDLYLP